MAHTAAILLVDDDVELCALLTEYLGGHGYRVSAVYDGAAGLRSAVDGGHDLVILDVMLPVLDGFEVLRQLRLRSNLPVIMLTARAEEHDRVQGFGDGVDDYLVKPFAAAELLGRIRAVLRRTMGAPASAAGPTVLGALTLDTREREAYWDGAALGLTATEFAVLDMLARAGGRVVSRDELTAVLHQREATPFERALDVHVSHLRRKIAAAAPDAAHAGSLIRAVRGVGYICSLER